MTLACDRGVTWESALAMKDGISGQNQNQNQNQNQYDFYIGPKKNGLDQVRARVEGGEWRVESGGWRVEGGASLPPPP